MLSSRSSETAAGRYFIRVYPPHRAGSRFEYPPESHAAGRVRPLYTHIGLGCSTFLRAAPSRSWAVAVCICVEYIIYSYLRPLVEP